MNVGQKIFRVMALLSFLLIMTIAIPLGYGYEWSPEMMLTWNNEIDSNPSIAQAGDGKVWVAWHSYRTGNADIFYKVYDSSKVHPWSSEKNLTEDTNADISPSIMQANDGKIWVVWSTNRTGNYEIYCKNSSDNGATWSQEQNLTANPKEDECSSIMQTADGTVWLAWSANRTGNFDIYCKNSSDNGATWSTDKFLNYPTTNDQDPSIAQDVYGNIWFVWVRNVIGTETSNIWYKKYDAASNTWGGTTQVTTDSGDIFNLHPSVMSANDGKIWVVWDSDKVGGQADIYYQTRSPPLFSATQIIRLTSNTEDDIMPSIMHAADGTLWTIWATVRVNNWDIRYMTTKIPQLNDVAIFSVIPTEVTVDAGEEVFIEVVAQNHGTSYTSVIVRLYADLTWKNESDPIGLSPGQLYPINLTWTALDSGTYKIWAKASVVYGEIYTVDNTFPAILCDVNDDRTVNVSDLSVLSNAYGSRLGDSNWNPDCNFDGFDGDNNVDALDLFELGKNYGKSQ